MQSQIKAKTSGSLMLWETFCWNRLGKPIPLTGRVTTNQYVTLID